MGSLVFIGQKIWADGQLPRWSFWCSGFAAARFVATVPPTRMRWGSRRAYGGRGRLGWREHIKNGNIHNTWVPVSINMYIYHMIIYVHILSYMYIYCTYMYMIFVYITPKLYAWAHLVVQVSVILLYSISAQKSVAMFLSPYDFCRDRGTPMLRDQSSPEVLQAFALRDWDSTEIVQEVSRHIIDPSKNVNMVFFYFFFLPIFTSSIVVVSLIVMGTLSLSPLSRASMKQIGLSALPLLWFEVRTMIWKRILAASQGGWFFRYPNIFWIYLAMGLFSNILVSQRDIIIWFPNIFWILIG